MTQRGTGTAEELLRANGLTVPDDHAIVSLAERPDLIDPSDRFNGLAWPDYMLGTPVANGQFGRCFSDWPQFQFVLLDAAGEIVATNNAMPLAWDGTDDGLPTGWEDQVIRGVADFEASRPLNTQGAMQIVVRQGLRGGGFAGTMLGAMRAAARAAGYAPSSRASGRRRRINTHSRRSSDTRFGRATTGCRSTRGSASTHDWVAGSCAPRPSR